MEISEDEFEVRKLPSGVIKMGGRRWGARVWHPTLRHFYSLGSYGSPEEAAVAVKKEKAEFQKLYGWKKGTEEGEMAEFDEKVMLNVNFKTSMSASAKGKHIRGVSKRCNKWHPDFKHDVSFSTCNSPEAADVASQNREEFWKMYGGKKRAVHSCNVVCRSDCFDKTSLGAAERGKHFVGFSKRYGKWWARVWHPKRKIDISLGSYFSPEDAAAAVKKKKAEFEEFMLKDSASMEISEDEFRGRKRPSGVIRMGDGRWGARVWHPALSHFYLLGSYVSPKEAAVAINKEKAEFEKVYGSTKGVEETEMVEFGGAKGMGNIHVETSLGVSEEGEHFIGVSKRGDKWQARVWDSKLKRDIHLGYYCSREEDAAAVKKKAEFEMLKVKDCAGTSTSEDDIEQRKLPSGASGNSYDSWSAQIWHPEIAHSDSSGSYGSFEEDASFVNTQRGVYQDVYGLKKGTEPTLGGMNGVVEEPDCEILSTFDCWDEYRAVSSFHKEKPRAPATKRVKIEFDESVKYKHTGGHDSEAICDPECESGYEHITSVIGSENLNSRGINDGVDAPEDLQKRFRYGSATSVLELVDVSDVCQTREDSRTTTVFATGFDEAVNSGIMNEYGQLLGMYSILDEQMELCPPDEDVAGA